MKSEYITPEAVEGTVQITMTESEAITLKAHLGGGESPNWDGKGLGKVCENLYDALEWALPS